MADLFKLGAAAAGIPDRSNLGDLSQLKPGLVDFVIQRHLADRAGPHYDVRLGTPDTGLYSWATKHELPEPGKRRALFQQPLHSHAYGAFEGEIPSGYGKGQVSTHRKGQVLITAISPDKIEFTTADKKHPERFAMIRPQGWKDKDWLLINRTPTAAVPYNKVRYKRIPAERVDSVIDQMRSGDTLEAKLDGASSLIKLLGDGAELLSYRTSKTTNRPIVHTERFFGGAGKLPIPPELRGTVLKGELYGERQNPRAVVSDNPGPESGAGDSGQSGKVHAGVLRVRDGGDVAGLPERPSGSGQPGDVIPPQELGGILNASLAESLRKQQDQNVNLKNMVYDIQQLGNKPVDWHATPRLERRRMIEQVLQHLPADKFHISEAATTPDEARKLWGHIKDTGYTPATEGVVYWPLHGVPAKSKLLEDQDVHITGTFPGEGKYLNKGIGGFTYAGEPGGQTVGRVGTGLSDELRQDAFNDPDSYIGRVARIQSQHKFPSGAYRAPALISIHEDYPMNKDALFSLGKLAAEHTTLPVARKRVAKRPTEAQRDAGNYRKGHTRLHGLSLSLENPKGSTRSGVSSDGKPWSVEMKHDYGYIKGTEGKDGDHVDVFVGPDPKSELVHIVNQHNQDGEFDEHKCLLGFNNKADAEKGYLSNYSRGWTGLGSIHSVTIAEFKKWLRSKYTKQKFEPEHAKAAGAKHTLVTGYSGSGKSTLGKQLSTEQGKPLVSLDNDERLSQFMKGQPFDAFRQGGPLHDDFLRLRREAVIKALSNEQPSIIEGTQIAKNIDLADGHTVILCDTPERQVIRQRLNRDRAKGKWGPLATGSTEARNRGIVARQLIAELQPYVAALRSNPNVQKLRAKKEANRKCPGCGQPFKADEPYPDVDNCEVCERFGSPKSKQAAPTLFELGKLCCADVVNG